MSTYQWNEMQSRVALTVAYLPQASYLFKMIWDALQSGPNHCLLTTSQLLIQIKIILTYTRKYRIFTAIENYLNT